MIPVAIPDIGELEEQYVLEAIRSGWVSSIGPFVDRFEREFANFCEVEHGIAMSNGTDALLVTLRALGIGPGDEVVVPALTFAAVPAVVAQLGATVVLADVQPECWCIDPRAIERAISERTKAIVVVHLYGHPANMDPILELAKHKRIAVIEDCAEAHGARYKGRRVGSIGDAGCFSFYGNKIITTGEGGMVTTNNTELSERVRFLKDHAMHLSRRYFHTEVGYNCRMTNIQAALGCAQLQRIDEFLARRNEILQWYRDALADCPYITLNPSIGWAEPVNWMMCAVLGEKFETERDSIISGLKNNGIDSRPFFVPISVLPPYQSAIAFGAEGNGDHIAKMLGRRGLNLPTSVCLDKNTVHTICSWIKDKVA
jgi:perosamine synthetase